MDDQGKNLILATVLSFLVILVWYTFFAPPPVDPTTTPAAVTATEGTASEAPAAAATETAAPVAAATATETALAAAPRITIDTPRLQGTLSLMGGRIDDLYLKDYKVSLDQDAALVRLLAPVGTSVERASNDWHEYEPGDKPYYAVYGWSPAGGLDAALVPDARTIWQVESGDTLAPGKPVTLVWSNGAGLTFRRVIEVDGNFLFTVTQSVQNTGTAPVTLAPYGIIVRHGEPRTQGNWILHEGVVRRSDGQLQETDFPDMPDLDVSDREGGPADVIEVTADGWTGFTDRYWMTSLIPAPGSAFTSVVKYVPGSDLYQTETRMPAMTVDPGASAEARSMLFAGAKEWEVIRTYQDDL
ncbi:MAG: hypothetical protein RLZZ528_150, partial [Pseudomonadota bacterium]